MKQEFVIKAEAGLHARPASVLVQQASKYNNDITLHYNGKSITLKSIMLVISLGVGQGETVEIEVDGDNAEQVLEQLRNTLEEQELI
jgi:phosphocarrier protein